MQFECDGKKWETLSLREIETGMPGRPYLYVSADGREVFVHTREHWTGVNVRRATEAELKHFAASLNLPELLKAVG